MLAAVRSRYGPPSVVRIVDVQRPEPTGNELLVKIHATTVNRTDCAYRSGKPEPARLFYGLVRPKAAVLGNEFAGQITETGPDVRHFAVGDRVFGYNEGPFGAHAEYLLMPEDGSLATMPTKLSYFEAAPGTEGSHYALSMIRGAKIRSGQTVMVYGATGGIGSAAVQLLRSLDVDVTAVCAGAHVELVKTLGADRVIDYQVEDFSNDDRRYDVVVDAVGKSTYGRCKRLLKPGGSYLSSELGPLAQNLILGVVTPLFRGRKVLFPIPKHNQEMVRYFRQLMEAGEFTPVIDRRYPLDRIVDAYRYVETGQKIGNVVIDVAAAD